MSRDWELDILNEFDAIDVCNEDELLTTAFYAMEEWEHRRKSGQTFLGYDQLVEETLVCTDSHDMDVLHMAFGLVEEAGEVAGKFKRFFRGDYGIPTLDGGEDNDPAGEEVARLAIEEMGDVLWYLAALAKLLGTDLQTIARQSATKLRDRKARNVLNGEGDHR